MDEDEGGEEAGTVDNASSAMATSAFRRRCGGAGNEPHSFCLPMFLGFEFSDVFGV